MDKLKKALLDGAEKLQISISESQYALFEAFTEILLQKNKVMNLTAITEPEEIAVKHYLDSLTVLKYAEIPQGASIIDVGTGAGFPSIPLLIARPDLKITMIDGTEKRLKFIRETLDALGLNGNAEHLRAEEAGKKTAYRERFDFATARAVARLNVISEYCIPLIKVGGTFIAMKSEAKDEITEAGYAIKQLGAEIGAVERFDLPDSSARTLIIIKKLSQTSPKYPRASTQIAKKPLK